MPDTRKETHAQVPQKAKVKVVNNNDFVFMKEGVLVEETDKIGKLTEGLKKRIEELVTTEDDYAQALGAITENRAAILKAVMDSKKFNAEQKIEFEKALELISAMRTIHERLHNELTTFHLLSQQYLEAKDKSQKDTILESMDASVHSIKVLSNISNAYVIEYTVIYNEGILDLFDRVIDKKVKDQINTDLKKNTYIQKQNSSINHLWIQPVQRTARYPLLFGDITKEQNPQNPFATILKDIEHFFKSYAQKSNEALSHRQSEAKRYMYTTYKAHKPKLTSRRDFKITSPLSPKAKTLPEILSHIKEIAAIEGHSFKVLITELDDNKKAKELAITDENKKDIMKIRLNASNQIEIEFVSKNLDYHALEIAQGILQSLNVKHEYIKVESKDSKLSELMGFLKQIHLSIESKTKTLLIEKKNLPIKPSDKMETLLLDYQNVSIHNRYERAGGKNAPKGSVRAGQIELLERIIRDLKLDKSYSNREKEMILAGVLENYQTQLIKDQKNSKLFKVVNEMYAKLPKEAKNQLSHPASQKFIAENNIYAYMKNQKGPDAMKSAFDAIDKSNAKKNKLR